MDFPLSRLPADNSEYPIGEDTDAGNGSKIVHPSAHALEMLDAVAEALVPFAMPIYYPDERERAQGYGSSVLIEVGPSVFLATAAHVIDKNEKDTLYVPGAAGELTPLHEITLGDSYRTNAAWQGSREDDIFDFACVEVDMEAISRQFDAVTVRRVDPNDRSTKTARYLLIGLPWRKNRPKSYKRVKRSLVSHSARSVDASTYEAVGLDPALHVALEFNPKEVYMPKRIEQGHGPLAKPANQEGMSGGPIWRVPARAVMEGNGSAARLVGLCAELKAEEQTIFGSRIGFVLETIRKTHKHLSKFIPEMRVADLTIQSIRSASGGSRRPPS